MTEPTDMTATAAPKGSWARWLRKDEELLWVGQPVVNPNIRPHCIFGCIVGLPIMAFFAGLLPNIFPILEAFGTGTIVGAFLFAFALTVGWALPTFLIKREASAFYSLTTKRAVVTHSWPWRRKVEYPLHSVKKRLLNFRLDYSAKTVPPSIYFKTSGGKHKRPSQGFLRIKEAKVVLEHLRQLGITPDP